MSTVARLTIEQYDRMINSGLFDNSVQERIELIHGEMREMSPIGTRHDWIVQCLTRWSVSNVPESDAAVRIQSAIEIPCIDSVPEPDVAWVLTGDYWSQRPQPKDVLLLIEVADTSLDYDRGEKAELYAQAGINDYWIVNIRERCLEVYRDPHEGHFRSLHTYTEVDETSSLAFPQVMLKVATLFPADPAND